MASAVRHRSRLEGPSPRPCRDAAPIGPVPSRKVAQCCARICNRSVLQAKNRGKAVRRGLGDSYCSLGPERTAQRAGPALFPRGTLLPPRKQSSNDPKRCEERGNCQGGLDTGAEGSCCCCCTLLVTAGHVFVVPPRPDLRQEGTRRRGCLIGLRGGEEGERHPSLGSPRGDLIVCTNLIGAPARSEKEPTQHCSHIYGYFNLYAKRYLGSSVSFRFLPCHVGTRPPFNGRTPFPWSFFERPRVGDQDT